MGDICLDRKAYAEAVGEPVELLEPIPALALASYGVAVTAFQLAMPVGNGSFHTSFLLTQQALYDGAMVRYGTFRPVFAPFDHHLTMRSGDTINIIYTPGYAHD